MLRSSLDRSVLSFRIGNVLAGLLVVVVTAAWGIAQEGEPRFSLPDEPYRYEDIREDLQQRYRGCGPVRPTSAPKPTPAADLARQRDAARHDHRVALGRVLFHDDLLSKNRRRSCSSCHEQEKGFADGRARSRGFRGKRTHRNSMSIVNLAYHRGPLFWDGRAKSLEQMVVMPIEDPIEMGLALPELVERLRVEPGYAELFERAFGTPGVDEQRVAVGLAAFVRAIVSHGSRYDEGLAAVEGKVQKDFPNFTAAENHGKRLFFGTEPGLDPRRSCAACHVGRFYGFCGNSFTLIPEVLVGDAAHNTGLPRNGGRDDDGYHTVTGKDEDKGRFRAPSLRNVAVTGPYMHDGRFRKLEDVVEFYARGVRNAPNLDPVLQGTSSGGWSGAPPATARGGGRLPVSPMLGPAPGFPMSGRDRRDLVAFLETLTDEELLRDPRFSDPFR